MTELRQRRSHGYETARPDVQALVPRSARSILEVGCSTGALGAAVKARQPARILGVELLEEYASEARGRLDRVVVADVESFAAGPPPPEAPFDCLIAADVLEHLVDPWTALERLAGMLQPGASIVVSLPNVAYWRGLARIVKRRRWPRDDEGVFDRTHLRWFGPQDAADLLRGAGAEVEQTVPRYWREGWRLKLAELLARTPVADLLPPQILVLGRMPAG